MVSFAWWKTDAPSLNGAGIGLLRWRNHARSTLRKPDTLKTSYHYGIFKPTARNNAPDVASGATLQQMNRALKNLLLWLLISLLPIQGMAAVISASCAQAAAASVQHGAMAHHAAPAHCPSDSVDNTSDAGSDAAATHHASCSACAACCVGASAPPSTSAPAAGHAMSESCFAALGMTDNGFIPTGPERPPRFS